MLDPSNIHTPHLALNLKAHASMNPSGLRKLTHFNDGFSRSKTWSGLVCIGEAALSQEYPVSNASPERLSNIFPF